MTTKGTLHGYYVVVSNLDIGDSIPFNFKDLPYIQKAIKRQRNQNKHFVYHLSHSSVDNDISYSNLRKLNKIIPGITYKLYYDYPLIRRIR